jgi:hypothetical protein
MNQQTELQTDANKKLIYGLGVANIAKQNAQIAPTQQKCTELSKNVLMSTSMASSAGGGSRPSGGKVPTPVQQPQNIQTDVQKQAMVINQKGKIGACSQTDISANIGGCGPGVSNNFGGNANIPSSDITFLSLKGDTNTANKTQNASSELASYTVSPDGQEVANQFINNATLYNAPKALTTNQLKQNPGYAALYDTVMVKLYAAQQAMKDVLSLRLAPNPAMDTSSSNAAYVSWSKNKDAYTKLFNMAQPANPSLMDFMSFYAAKDFADIPSDTAKTQDEILTELNRKMALNNMIALKSLNQQENISILLSMMLTQMVTPADINKVNSQFDRINSTTPQ